MIDSLMSVFNFFNSFIEDIKNIFSIVIDVITGIISYVGHLITYTTQLLTWLSGNSYLLTLASFIVMVLIIRVVYKVIGRD